MAYPTITSYSTGVIDTPNQYTHSITLPATINAGDLILVALTAHDDHLFCTVDDTSSSANFKNFSVSYKIVSTGDDTGWGWFWVFDNGTYTYPLTTSFIAAKAIGGGSDILSVNSMYTFRSKYVNGETYSIYAKPSYICYSISNVKWMYGGTTNYNDSPIIRQTVSGNTSTNWDLNPLYSAGKDDSDSGDHLWLSFYTAGINRVVTAAPASWTNLITAQGSVLVLNSTSLSSCRINSTGVTNIDPGAATAPSAEWIGVLMKIYPDTGASPTDITTDTSVGVGTLIYQKEIEEPIIPLIEILPVDQKYYSDETPHEDNPYGYYVQVKSTHSWTSAWDVGTYFYADTYSGNAGITYISINCVDVNESAGSYIDTLIFSISGSNDSVTAEQYNYV